MELSEDTIEDVGHALNVSSETLLGLLEREDSRAVVERIAAFVVDKNEEIVEYERALEEFSEHMDSKDAEINEKMVLIERLQTRVGVLEAERSDMEEIQEQQAEQLEAEQERAVERESLLSQMRERCVELESQSRDGMSEGEDLVQLQERYVHLEMQSREHEAEMEEAISKLHKRCTELEELQEQDGRSREREMLLELQQQYADLKAQSCDLEKETKERLAALQMRCTEFETQSKLWVEERELFNNLKVRYEELEVKQESTQDMLDEIEESCAELENENKDLEEELTITKEQLQQAREELKPPPDIPGADREELLRLLDRRQVEISRLTEEWRGLADRLETTSSAKQEIQAHLDELVSQEASLRLREQLFAQEKALLQEQNHWLSVELESKSSEVLLVRKEKDILQADLQGKVITRDQELSLLKTSLEAQTSNASELGSKLEASQKRLAELRDEQVTVEDTLRRELSSQAKLAVLYQSASEAAESKVDELVRGMEEMQETVENISREKEEALAQLGHLKEQFAISETEANERISSLEKELGHANELLTTWRRKGMVPLPEVEVLSISPVATSTSALLKSGMTLTQIYSKLVETSEQLQTEKEENTHLNNYLQQILQELDEKTPALQKLRRDHDLAVEHCTELQQKLESVIEKCDLMRLEGEDSIKNLRASERENKRLQALISDLGRQVRVLLKECEEARGGVVSTSHDWSRDLSSDDITSSSHVISEHLVTFKTVEDLQQQNQRLLAVVRELSEEREKEEHMQVSKETQQLQGRLDEALRELDLLREGRERQKVMVESIVKQRDMYRVLLAQSTLVPPDVPTQEEVSRDSVHLAGSTSSTPRKPSITTVDSSAALDELRKQFDTYRQEKKENDQILQQQISEYREQASSLRLDNAKIAARLENFHERYQLLETTYNGLKKEQTALRDKEKQLSDFLARHQATIDSLSHELLDAKEKLARAESSQRSLTMERNMLSESEGRARMLYENLLHEQHGRNTLLVNLQSIQNNLEKNEFETKTRLGSQIESLEKEVALLKEKAHSDEEQRARLVEAYETQVRDFTQKLEQSRESEQQVKDALRDSQERESKLDSELSSTSAKLVEVKHKLEESVERIKCMEEDAGAEFRNKIRLLERKLADSVAKVSGLEDQLSSAQEHRDQFQSMSQANEEALQEMTRTAEEVKTSMELQLQTIKTREEQLVQEMENEKREREQVESELNEELQDTQEALRQMQEEVLRLQSCLTAAEANVQSAEKEVVSVRNDAQQYVSLAEEKQELYQRELVQHGRTMEELSLVKDKNRLLEEELQNAQQTINTMKEDVTTTQLSLASTESRLQEECQTMQQHCQDLTQQNNLLHSESEKLLAKICTLTQTVSGEKTLPLVAIAEDSGNGSGEHLWELVRFVRREKDIAETKKEMAEDENVRLTQSNKHLQRKLQETELQLQELSAIAKTHSETASQYEEVMAKVQTLNVISDSNKLLREEKNTLREKLSSREEQYRMLEAELLEAKEANVTLKSTKNSLLAEKTALKNEVDRWTMRTNQLIEQYNQVDPEEYKKLIEEREEKETQMESLSSELDSLKIQLAEAKGIVESEKSSHSQVQERLSDVEKKFKELSDEAEQLRSEAKANSEELNKRSKVISKLREIARKFRDSSVEQKKEIEDLQKKLDEAASAHAEPANEREGTSELHQQIQKLTQELETARQEVETQKAAITERDDKFNKVLKTARSLKAKNDMFKSEKEELTKTLEEARADVSELEKKVEDVEKASQNAQTGNGSLKEELARMQQKHETEIKQLEEQVLSLQQELRVKASRHKAQPQTELSSSQGAPLTTVHSAPTAAVKPTVTTTPTASIRPMPLHTCTAPTAHVTPTQVIHSVSTPSTLAVASSQSTNQVAPVVMATTLEALPATGIAEVMPTSSSIIATMPTSSNTVGTMPTSAAATMFVSVRSSVVSEDERLAATTSITTITSTSTSSTFVTSSAATPFTMASWSAPAVIAPSTDRATKRIREEASDSSIVESPASKRIRELPSSVTTAEPSTTTDQQAVPADAETTPTSMEMTDNEQPEAVADTQTYEQQQTPVMAVDPAQVQEVESITMVTDSIAVVTGTDEDAVQSLPQQSGDLAADTTSGAPDSKSELSPPQQEPQEGVGEEETGEEEEEVRSSEMERQGRGISAASSGPDPLVTQEVEGVETREQSVADEEETGDEEDSDRDGDDNDHEEPISEHPEGHSDDDHEEDDEESHPDGQSAHSAIVIDSDTDETPEVEEGREEDERDEEEQEDEEELNGVACIIRVDPSDDELQVDMDTQDGRAEVSEEMRPDLVLPGPSTSTVLPSVMAASDSSSHPMLLVPDDSMGLPDEEITVTIPAQADPPTVTMATSTAPSASESVRRFRLNFAEQRASTPGYEMGVPTLGEDHTVPCTPVLAENKQLSKAQAVQSVPAESASENRQLEVSESFVASESTAGLQSLGDTQIEQLTSTTTATLPLPSSSIPPRTPSPLRPTSPRHVSGHVGADGALDDDAINDIIADDNGSTSSSDMEEGELVEEAAPTTTTDHTKTLPSDAPPSSKDVDPVASSSGSIASSSKGTLHSRKEGATRKIRPIVWDPPTSSSGSMGQPPSSGKAQQGKPTGRRIIHRGLRSQKHPAGGHGKGRGMRPKGQ